MKRFMTFFLSTLFAFAFCYANGNTALLRYNLEEGQTYTYNANFKIKVDPVVDGLGAISIPFVIKYKVQEVFPDGSIKLGCTIRPTLENVPEQIAESYAIASEFFKDFEVQVVHSARGKILDVINLEKIIHKIYEMSFDSDLDDADSDEELLDDMMDYLKEDLDDDVAFLIAKVKAAREEKTDTEEDLQSLDSVVSFCDSAKIEGEKLLEKTSQFQGSIVDIDNLSEGEKQTLTSLKDTIRKLEKEVYMQGYTVEKIKKGYSSKSLLEKIYEQPALYPELPVQAGEHWINTYKFGEMQSELSTVTIVKDVNDQTVTLEEKFIPLKIAGNSISFDNTMSIDRASGMVSSQQTVLNLATQIDLDDEDEEDEDSQSVSIEILLDLVK